jgi:hypothetical protein
MASPYYTKQPTYIEEPSGRFQNILAKEGEALGYTEMGGGARNTISYNTPSRINFPFTPTISIIQSANYTSYDLTHTNFQQRAFDMHTNMELNITAPMIVRSVEEALYVYKASLWIRSTMKMSWMRDKIPGMPPPILRFYAHGIYENVPCIIRDFTWNLDSDIDYVEIIPDTKKPRKIMRIPVSNMFVLSLSTTYSPKSIRENFSVEDYLKGNLKDKGYV